MTHFGFNNFKLNTKNPKLDPSAQKVVRYKSPETILRIDIKHLLSKGLTIAEIAEELGRTKSAISSQIKRMGLQQRKGQ